MLLSLLFAAAGFALGRATPRAPDEHAERDEHDNSLLAIYDRLGDLDFPIDIDYWAKAAKVPVGRLEAAVFDDGQLTPAQELRARAAARRFLAGE